MESHGTFGTIWASLGMTAYYMALIWINLLLGLFLGLGIAVALDLADNTVKSEEDIVQRLQAPFLGLLPLIEEKAIAGAKTGDGRQATPAMNLPLKPSSMRRDP